VRVTVKYSGLLRAQAGKDQEEVALTDGASIHQMVEVLCRIYPESPYRHPQTLFVVNDRFATREQILAPGDQVRVFQMIAGG
jgi:molybdopterin converting factor small subunit